ncbi:hypothetical protein CesoFtcFv8_001535 [Champsocephalus esox]|uniref:Uncharacterized protein n=1 Tax=Champsocephalus esox TaxID=159716 RepID=A0AAN8D3T3_9TELE|nr:hypothetical protein CesoFtcFv8_001535 [Champsocephalus esox]
MSFIPSVLKGHGPWRPKEDVQRQTQRSATDLRAWEDMAADGATWRNLVREGAALYDDDLCQAALRKGRATATQVQPKPSPATFQRWHQVM